MVGRVIRPSVVQDTINNGIQEVGRDERIIYTSTQARVITPVDDGDVVTLWPNRGVKYIDSY